MNATTFKNYVKVVSMKGNPFYASDLGLLGGHIGGLHHLGLIKPTGNTKTMTIQLEWDEEPRQVTVKEWVQADSEWLGRFYQKRCGHIAKELLQNVEALEVIASILD